MNPTRVLILMSRTGGGHESAARAIAEALQLLYPGTFEVFQSDVLEECLPFPANRMQRLYLPIVNYSPTIWKALWTLTDGQRTISFTMETAWPVLRSRLVRLLRHYRPDLLVSVHPLLNHLPNRARQKLGRPVPMITVVTDPFSVHPFWICPEIERILVATEAAREAAIRWGARADQVAVVGQPISPAFRDLKKLDREELRRKLGLVVDRPTALLMGGGEGMGPVYEIARAIAERCMQAQLAIIAGRNESLRQQLVAEEWPIPVHVEGFVTNIPEWMAAADVLITKAGPGTIAEGLAAGLPIILSGYIPGQEEGNIAWVLGHGAGVLVEDPETIAAVLAEWFRPENPTISILRSRAQAIARPDSALLIAQEIAAMSFPLEHPDPLPHPVPSISPTPFSP